MNSITVALLLFVGVAACHHSHHGWKSGHKYQYEMRGRNVAGLQTGSNQFVGVLTRGVVNVQPKTDGRVNFQIENPEQLEVQQHLHRGWKTFIPDEGANYSPLPLESNNFDLEFEGGVVKKMWVPQNTPTHEANIFKAVASLFQMDTTASKSHKSHDSQNAEPLFKTNEDTVHGKVETEYYISPSVGLFQTQPRSVQSASACSQSATINVQKHLNFDKARHMPMYHYGFSDLEFGKIGGNRMGNMLSRSVSGQAVVCGDLDNFVVQSSVTTDKVVIAPHLYNTDRGMVVSEFNLTLINVVESQYHPQGISSESREYENLMYEYNTANANVESETKSRNKRHAIFASNMRNKNTPQRNQDPTEPESPMPNGNSGERVSKSSWKNYWQPRPTIKSAPKNPFLPYFIAVEGNSIQASPKLNGVEKTENLANSIGRDMVQLNSITYQQTLSKFTRLVDLLQTMNEDQMNKATEKLYVSFSKLTQQSSEDATRYNAWMAFRDATAEAGTGPALLVMKSWINTCKVSGEEAAELVATISKKAHYPSEEFIQSFFDLVSSNNVIKTQHLNSSAVISFAEIVRKVLVSKETISKRYPVHSFGRPTFRNSTLVAEKFVPFFESQLTDAIRQGDSNKVQLYVWAMGLVAHPNVLPIFERYLNRTASVSNYQRLSMIASLTQLAKLYPKSVRPIMYNIYQNTEENPEIRVAAVMQLMKTNPPAALLQRMAEFTNYETSKQVNSAVKSALESAARDISSNGNQLLSQNARAAVNLLTNYEYGSQYSKIYHSSWGKKNTHLSYVHELSLIQRGDSVLPSSIFCSMKRQIGGFQNPASETFFSTSSIANLWSLISSQIGYNGDNESKPARGQPSWDYETLSRHLNISVEPEEQVEGSIFTSFMGSNRLFTFDNHTVNQIPEFVRKVVNDGRVPKQFNVTKIFDQLNLKIAFPTAMGLPFSYSFNVPTMVAFRGQAHGKVYPDPARHQGQILFPKTMNVSADLNILYSASSEGKMGFVTPFNQKEYLAGLKRQVQFYLPLNLKADVDMENSQLRWELQPLNAKASSKLFESSTVPYTAIQNIIDILNPSINTEVINVRKTKKVQTTMGDSAIGMALDLRMETQQQFLTWSNVYEAVRQHNFMTALMYPFAEETINYNNFSLTYNGPKSEMTVVRGVMKYRNVYSDSTTHQKPLNVTSPREMPTEFDSYEREMQMIAKATNGIENATARVFDMSIKFKGPKQEKVIVASAALGSSQVQNRSQIVLFSSIGGTSQAAEYKISAELNSTSPLLHRINLDKTLPEDSKIRMSGKLNFGRDDDVSEVKLDMKMKKSDENRQDIEMKPLTKVCRKQMAKGELVQPACRNVTGRSGDLDEYEANIKYENISPALRKTSWVIYTIGRYYVTDYLSESLTGKVYSEGSGNVHANWRFSSSERSANLSISSPAIDAQFTRIPINSNVASLLNIHPTYNVISRVVSDLTRNQHFPICVVEKDVVNTFDNLTYPTDLGDCWYTMAHSFPKQMNGLSYPLHSTNFSVQLRKQSSDKMQVKLVLDENVIDLQHEKTRPLLLWNNASTLITKGRVSTFGDVNKNGAVLAYVAPGNLLIVESPKYNMQLLYDGNRVVLQLANNMRENVRGLCGNFNGEKIDDLMGPNNCVYNNPFEFASKYVSIEKSCHRPQIKSSGENTEHCTFMN